MSKINLAIDELQKLEASQQFESIREKRKELARKFRERNPHYSKDHYWAHRTGKVHSIKSNSKQEWIRETVIDPSKRDNRVLIDVEKYAKKQDLNIIEIQEKHYREFMANHQQVNESNIAFPETPKQKVKTLKKKRKVTITDKKNKVVKREPRKAVKHLTKLSGVNVTEFPVKSEPYLGFYPQLPLLDVNKFKNFHFDNEN